MSTPACCLKTLALSFTNLSITRMAWVSASSTMPRSTTMKLSEPNSSSTDCWCSCTMSAISMKAEVKACAYGVCSASARFWPAPMEGARALNSVAQRSASERRMNSVYFSTPSRARPKGWKSLAKRLTAALSFAMIAASKRERTATPSCCSASHSTRIEASSVPGGRLPCDALNRATYRAARSKSSVFTAFITWSEHSRSSNMSSTSLRASPTRLQTASSRRTRLLSSSATLEVCCRVSCSFRMAAGTCLCCSPA
mmetsp:Transcript_72244/g.182145  ORF Transcript_72244/g.182145 Transcript_72244/m.182145 type:complete len:255 (+) Transcript_72244:1355-2119(+)